MTDRPILATGSWGPDVLTVQSCLEVEPLDGDFGDITGVAVEKFQKDFGLDADGVVGPSTWAKLDEQYELPPYPVPLLSPLTTQRRDQIYAIVDKSKVAKISWKDRGLAPPGYVKGMAIGFATVIRKYLLRHSVTYDMSLANTLDADHDVLTWYGDVFANLEMDNSESGLGILRHLWTLLYGLGMRESSGKYCCGRDMSASNVSSDTAEAGLFQMSWNASNSSPHMERLLDEYSQDGAAIQGAIAIFKEGVKCSQKDFSCYGSGTGAMYQSLAKLEPQFAAETCAVGLRKLRQHWGPINRKEAEVKIEVDGMFFDIQELLAPVEV